MVSKEYWANLSDEDKSKIIRRFCEINDIGPDFDYAKVRDFSEMVKQKYKESGIYRNNQFWEQNFDGFLNKLKEYPDIEYLGEVIEHSWGQRVIRFYDLDGHIIEVGEDMKMVIKRFLSSGMTMEEISVKMDASVEDLTKLLNN